MPTQWEYKTVKIPINWDGRLFARLDFAVEPIDDALNAFGAEGWELVSTPGIQVPRGETGYLCAIFKRPKQ